MSQAGSEFIFEETKNYVMQRKAFGKTLADLQVDFLLVYLTCVYFCALLPLRLCFLPAWMNLENRLCSTSWPS